VGAAWIGLVTPYTLGTGPLGFLDGQNGAQMRKLALGTPSGDLTSLTVTGNVAHAVTSYAHGISNGDRLAVWNSGNSALDVYGNAASQPYGCYSTYCSVLAYTAQNVTTYTFDFVTSGVSNGTYTGVNLACGPAGTPNGTIGETRIVCAFRNWPMSAVLFGMR